MGSKVTLSQLLELGDNCGHVSVVALVIFKSNPTYFRNLNSPDPKGVIHFTIRDVDSNITNLKVWSSEIQILELNRLIKIGDVVEILTPLMEGYKLPSGNTETQKMDLFCPLPTVPIQLLLRDNHQGTLIKVENGEDEQFKRLKELQHMPYKPLSTVMKLKDIKNFEDAHGYQYTDLLVVIAARRVMQEVELNNKTIKCLNLLVYDESHVNGLIFCIWNEEYMEKAINYWITHKTVLYLLDVKVTYSEYYKAPVIKLARRSLIIEDPVGEEAKTLATFAAHVGKELNANTAVLPNANEIVDFMTINQIYQRINENIEGYSDEFCGIVRATVAKFNISKTGCVSKKCKNCQRILENIDPECPNEECILKLATNDSGQKVEYFYNFTIELRDLTGTLYEARIKESAAERLLERTPIEFMQMSEERNEALKCYYILLNYETKLMIRKSYLGKTICNAFIVDMKRIQMKDYLK